MLPFVYTRVPDVRRAAEMLGQAPEAMAIAGGTDMLQLLQEAVIAPSMLVDLNEIALRGIEEDEGGLRIGALTRLADIADDARVRQDYAVLAQALDETASAQVRNMATAGGNLLQRTRCLYFRDVTVPCNKRAPGSGCPAREGQNRMNAVLGISAHCIAAYPGDMANALLALDAELVLLGRRGERRIALEALHRPPGDTPHIETVLEPGELITWIVLPAGARGRRSRYLKVRDRATFEWALVSAAVAVATDGDVVREARVAVGGVATTPWRLRTVEEMLEGRRLDEAACRLAGDAAARGASAAPGLEFKPLLLRRVVERALLEIGGLT